VDVARRTALSLTLLAGLVALAAPASAGAATWATTSTNWAGYASSSPGTAFRRVSATWVAPAVHCGSRGRRYSAAWVGLGGFHTTSRALEQVGTEADCAGGKGYYSAWYELVPAGPVRLALTIRPGDTISASVTVSGHAVKLFVANRTRGTTFSKQLTAATVDVSSAEWIVEAPSACVDNGRCRALPLADFGTTSFANVSATKTTGHSGTVTDPAWSAAAISLAPHGGPGGMRFGSVADLGAAAPANLTPAGDGFTVTYGSAEAASTSPGVA
jgi:peptidase A4-like protein